MSPRAITVGVTNIIASPARQRDFLGIYNQGPTQTLYIAFDQPAVAAPTAGQLTIGAGGTPLIWNASTLNGIPWNQINIIASAASTPVTILE